MRETKALFATVRRDSGEARRHGEDNMEVLNREEIATAILEPH
jgi:hypothetical protein